MARRCQKTWGIVAVRCQLKEAQGDKIGNGWLIKVGLEGVEPTRLSAKDFKSPASAISPQPHAVF